LQQPTAGQPDDHARPTTGDAGPHDGTPATPTSGAAPAADARRALSSLSRTLRLAPRPDTAVRRPGAHPVRLTARRPRRPGFRGPIPGQIALFESGTSGLREAAASVLAAVGRQERSVAGLVAFLVLLAVVTATIPVAGAAGPSGGTDGLGESARLVAGGPGFGDGSGPYGPGDITGPGDTAIDGAVPSAAPGDNQVPSAELQVPVPVDQGSFLDDGTLLKPVAVDTTIPDSAVDVTRYKVKAGDTLTGIAAKFGVKMMTIWWANNLKNKNSIKPGQSLIIPPDDGLLVTVKEGQTLAQVGREYGVGTERIRLANDLPDETIYIGQTLFVPKAQGDPIATPTPRPKPTHAASGGGGGSSSGPVISGPSGPVRYSGGRMSWPVVGGGNYISQYYHYGHEALDIAGSYGSPVVAAAGGTVIFAGWRSNGGGYQVWISNGGNIYTTYNHMSAVSVGTGQSVGAGQRIGSLGQSGWATGPHLHFEVWVGFPWSGGYRVNPLGYVR
jgi:murein DD-endopeptidase MepM/ murein hydrolase activator NlpD